MLTSKFIARSSHQIHGTTITDILRELCAASKVDKLFSKLLDIHRYTTWSIFSLDLWFLTENTVIQRLHIKYVCFTFADFWNLSYWPTNCRKNTVTRTKKCFWQSACCQTQAAILFDNVYIAFCISYITIF